MNIDEFKKLYNELYEDDVIIEGKEKTAIASLDDVKNAKINNNAIIGDKEWGKSLTYLVLDNNRLIGLLSIRYDLSDELTQLYGHIGYGVRPSERGKGYATKMLKYALLECKKLGITKVKQTDRLIEIELPEELSNEIKGDKLLYESYSITPNFKLSYRHKNIIITLYYRDLKEHFIKYIVRLLNTL